MSKLIERKRWPADRSDAADRGQWGGLLEIVPLFFQKSTTTPVEGLKPYDAVVWPVATSTSAKAASSATRR
jgi:hypothetical protein